jgi:protein SCO1/2
MAAMTLAACSKPKLPLGSFKTVEDFALISQTGEAFHGSEQLKGKVWIANFIFTSCPGPCPRMSSQMSQVQKAVEDLADARLVSFTVDPKRDTPQILAGYAKYYGAKPGRWFFLTGAREDLDKLSFSTFQLSRVTDQMDHSTRFVLVDRNGRIRKYYETTENFRPADIAADAKILLEESGS